ncbi:MAG TPA: glycogen debranching N-terminal domain-containing protein [Acetobacteraceae bacterium]|jgi:glycogen debranching enzyme|nr:glycogen debranching N-terminal domain-containing protein [Acetobacteraceae bacterium]
MPFKVQVGSPQVAIHQGQIILLTEPDGQIVWSSDKGLYFFDTRVISAWSVYANGQPWELLSGGASTYDTARMFLTNNAFRTEDGDIPARTMGFMLSRAIDGGLHEDLDLTNHGPKPIRFNLEIAIRCDFADIFEVKDNKIVRRGHITTAWSEAHQRLSTVYRNRDFMRAISVRTRELDSHAVYANGRISFEIGLDPGATWHCCLLYDLTDGVRHFRAPLACAHHERRSAHADSGESWRRSVPRLHTSNEEFYRFYNQALDDMTALRLTMPGTDGAVLFPAAGLPWFVAPFGRDSLIASLQTILIDPGFARGALEVLGQLQATERDDWRDAEPGKILHEMRYGELAHFKLIPHTPYYGTADATPLYLIVLHAAWRATGDCALLEKHLATAEACLGWIDDWGDRDGDGFQEFQTQSPVGYENMAWKDAGDSSRDTDGSLVKGPKALCELQGYVYDAWQRMAEIYDALAQPDRAAALRAKAAALFHKFNENFWDEAGGFYAFMLDGEKHPIWSVASNPGHCLYSGIVPKERAERVVARLLAPDMSSGWGIRTLSALHPSYNPYTYQLGAVWPHDNAIIAAGCKRYGFADAVGHIARDISGAASHFLLSQVPELYAGIARDGTAFPVQYRGANVPQAWAAGSAFMLLQALLGIEPDAPRGVLHVDPVLPDWLPDVTLYGLRLGKRTFDLSFWRDGPATRFKVLRGDAAAVRARGETVI